MLRFSKLMLTGLTGIAGGIYIDRNVLPLLHNNDKEPESPGITRLSKSNIEVCIVYELYTNPY